ncbi:hypothetical protein SAMN05216197_15013 [Pseudomonas graminis]|uniref:Uncharacterized protein n=1 Tax=Pseudomonas graminis TaxID=158627 RepID=A0A1I0J8W6_9PSED|nr:hypothetical protein SAMN05216197_15013 [Pseudomonas graminis]
MHPVGLAVALTVGPASLIVPTLCVGMPPRTLRVPQSPQISTPAPDDAERQGMHSHAERGNDQQSTAYTL